MSHTAGSLARVLGCMTLLIWAALPGFEVSAQTPRPGQPTLLTPTQSSNGSPRADGGRGVTRSRRVVVATALLSRDSDADAPLDLPLFDDVHLRARRQGRVERTSSGGHVWKGRLVDHVGEATFATHGDVMAGTIFADGRLFEIVYAGDGEHEVREIDPSAFPTDDPGYDLPLGDLSGEEAPVAAADSASQIDVLVIWTPAARSAAGGTAAIQSLIDLAVANTNTSYANSGVTQRIRLVHKSEVTYTESAISTDLSRLAIGSDGYIDQAHTLRNTYGADLVSLVGNGYSGACGVGYLMASPSTAYAAYGFNVVERSCAAGNLSFAHELGHNMGLQHDPGNAGSAGAYSYAYGYQDTGGLFRTVMAYPCGSGACPRVTHFSNPAATYGGRPTGTSTQNNAAALNNTAATVANFRQAVSTSCSYSLGAASASLGAGAATGTVSVLAGSGCDWDAASNAGWITITSGSGGTGNAAVGYSVTANTSSSPRSGTLTLAGQTFTVNQAGASCSYTVSPTLHTAAAGGGSLGVSVSTGTSCTWDTTSHSTWLSVTANASGTGSGVVQVTATANPSTAGRTGTLTVANKTVTVSQPGQVCSISVDAAPTAFGRTGGTGAVPVTATATQCGWTISKNVSWITFSGSSSRTGSGTVSYSVMSYTGKSPRTGKLVVGGSTITITQVGTPRKQAVDFDLDGAGDALFYDRTAGGWARNDFVAGGFRESGSGNWGADWDVHPADFNGDDRSDLLLYKPSTGDWKRIITQPDGSFDTYTSKWGAGWSVTILDLNGDGKSDVFLYNAQTGQWYQCLTKPKLTDFYYRAGSWAPGWTVHRAALNTDARDDLFLYNGNAAGVDTNAGLWFRVITQRDLSFTYIQGDARWAAGWTITPADFSGDGISELFLYRADGLWFTVKFTRTSATYRSSQWAPGWTVRRTQFNGDRYADLFLYNRDTGMWFKVLTRSDGSFAYYAGEWIAGWDVSVTDLNRDQISDLLLYHPTQGMWAQVTTKTRATFAYKIGNCTTGRIMIASHVTLP